MSTVRQITVSLDAIEVRDRHRKDLGDVQSLADSIADVGLIQPIAVTPSMRLVAGQRRLEACRLLKWKSVPATVVADLDDARRLLVAERDENTCRKDMTTMEMVAIGRELEEMVRPEAKERQKEGGSVGGKGGKEASVNVTEPSDKPERTYTRDIVGAAVGMSGVTYGRAKAVVVAAEDEALDPAVRDVAKAALADMEKTGKVTPAYNRVRRAIKGEPFIPKSNGKVHTRTYPGRAAIDGIRKTVGTLVGLASGLASASVTEANLDAEEATGMERELAQVASTINRFRRQLKEHANVRS